MTSSITTPATARILGSSILVPGDVDQLDFGSIIRATDGDGDYVDLDDKLLIKIRDDVPDAKIKLTGASVIHDETPGDDGNDDVGTTSVADRSLLNGR